MPRIFKTLDKIEPVFNFVDKLFMVLCKLLLIGDIVITTLTVLQRYLPNTIFPAMPWGEQIVLTLMVYMTVLSAALAIRTNGHIRMNVFDQFLPKKLLKVSDLIADLLVLTLGVVMLVYGIQVCTGPLAKFAKYETIPKLSKMWMYLPVPIAGGAMIVFEIEAIYRNIRSWFVKEEEKEVQA